MDTTLLILFGVAGALSTYIIITVFQWGYNKENRDD